AARAGLLRAAHAIRRVFGLVAGRIEGVEELLNDRTRRMPTACNSCRAGVGDERDHNRTRVQGNARLAEASLVEEAAAALDATDKDVAIGGAGLAAAAIELGLVDTGINPASNH